MTSYLNAIHKVTDERVESLKNQIIEIQSQCSHTFGKEWQEYNIYSKCCEKCGHIHSEEY